MSTRLEGVMIPVEIDPSKALRQLDQMEQRVNELQKKARSLGMTQTGTAREAATQKATSTTPASGGTLAHTMAQKAMKALSQTPKSVAPVSGVLSKAGGTLGASEAAVGTGMLARAGGTVGTAIAAGAAVYGATRTAAKGGSALAAAAEGAFPDISSNPAFRAVAEQVRLLRSAINFIESKIGSVFTGATRTAEMTAALARVHGTIPNLYDQFETFSSAERFERELEKHFDDFKTDEIFRVIGRSVRGGIHR